MHKTIGSRFLVCLVLTVVASPGVGAWEAHPGVIDPLLDVGLRIELAGDQFVVRGQEGLGAGAFQPFDPTRGPSLRPMGIGAAEEETEFVSVAEVEWERIPVEGLKVTAAPDLGAAIQESTDSSTSSGFKQNSPISQLPYIRGYRGGQIYTVSDGQFFQGVRPDLDSMLGRIDPSLIKDVVIINGPYGLRYGPGFSFIDVQTFDSPRYVNGYESHARIGTSFRTNGSQIFGRTAAFGGSSDWGFMINFTDRAGADYSPGGNSDWSKIPSSYRVQNFLGQFGFDLSPEMSLEFRFNRVAQNDSEYAAQFFDIRELTSDAFSLALVYDNPAYCTKHRLEGWYNRSDYLGDTRSGSKHDPSYPVINRVEAALEAEANPPLPPNTVSLVGDTDGDLVSTGGRLASTYGEDGDAQLNMGADFRYVEQHISEAFATTNLPANQFPGLDAFNTNMPRAEMIDPGIFAEVSLPVLSYLKSSIGGRVDWIHTDANANEVRVPSTMLQGLTPASLPQDDVLLAFYVRNDIQIDSNLDLNLSAGYSERAPTLIERYADGLFLGILQSGFTRTIGNPLLRKERLWQIDSTVKADYGACRASVSYFYSWIRDVVYTGLLVDDPTGARLLRTENGSMATLWGTEVTGECDLTNRLSAIATLSYVEGQENWTNHPMAGIVPLESRIALRLLDWDGGSVWGLEAGLRIVDDQDRTAVLRRPNGTIEPDFEQSTPGFTTCHIRGYYNVTENLFITGGVENLFDRSYIEHLNLRLPEEDATRLPEDATHNFPATPVLSPGITPYINVELTY